MKKINLILIILILFFIGCAKKVEAPKPTPTSTPTPVPKLEKIVYTYNGHLFWINTDGSGKQELFADNLSKWFPSASPDGWYITYWVYANNEYNLFLGNLKNKTTTQLTFDKAAFEGDVNNFNIGNAPSWDKEGKFIVYSRFKDIWKIDVDGFNQLALTETHNCFAPSLSIENKYVFSKIESEDTYNLYIRNFGEQLDTKLTKFVNKKVGGSSFSRDGKKFVFTVIDEGNVNIYLYDLNSKTEKQLTYDGKSFSPAFNYEGNKIIFSSTITDKFQPEIWMMNIDGSERIRITNDGGVCPSFLMRILAEPLPTPTVIVEKKRVKQDESLEKMIGAEGATPQPTLTYNLTPPPIETKVIVPTQIKVIKPEVEELKVKVIKKDDLLLFYPVIHFDSAYANIKPEFYPILDDMAKIIKKYKISKIRIEGHTDNDPIKTKEYPSNLALSIARAKEVRKYLYQKHKIDLKRMIIKGYGENKPIVPNDSEENKYKNRRAEIIIVIDKSEKNIKFEMPPTLTPTPTETPTIEPTSTPTPTPTPKLNFFQKIFKPGKKTKKSATW